MFKPFVVAAAAAVLAVPPTGFRPSKAIEAGFRVDALGHGAPRRPAARGSRRTDLS